MHSPRRLGISVLSYEVFFLFQHYSTCLKILCSYHKTEVFQPIPTAGKNLHG